MTETATPEAKPLKVKARVPTEIKIHARRDLMDGYVLSPTGGTVADAIRSADISIPSNREMLLGDGCLILTQYNQNSKAAELVTQPPSLETCETVLALIDKRRPNYLAFLQKEIDDAAEELEEHDLNRGERSYWRARKKALEVKLAQDEVEDINAEELYKWLVREDVSIRAAAVPPEMRAAMEAIERERALATL